MHAIGGRAGELGIGGRRSPPGELLLRPGQLVLHCLQELVKTGCDKPMFILGLSNWSAKKDTLWIVDNHKNMKCNKFFKVRFSTLFPIIHSYQEANSLFVSQQSPGNEVVLWILRIYLYLL